MARFFKCGRGEYYTLATVAVTRAFRTDLPISLGHGHFALESFVVGCSWPFPNRQED